MKKPQKHEGFPDLSFLVFGKLAKKEQVFFPRGIAKNEERKGKVLCYPKNLSRLFFDLKRLFDSFGLFSFQDRI